MNFIIQKFFLFIEQPSNCPCHNGGLCVQLPNNNMACSCRYGFTGDFCEKSIIILNFLKLNSNCTRCSLVEELLDA